MTETIVFTVPGTPIAKGRPRFYNGRAVTDAKTRAVEQAMLAAWLQTVGARDPHEGPVEVEVLAVFNPADSWPKWKRAIAKAGQYPHLSKPDLDNLIKTLDGLNGRAWRDDSQIVEVRARKQYGSVAQTTVAITFHPAPPTRKEN